MCAMFNPLIIAVIYDDSLTDAFFNCLVQLTSVMFETPPTVLVSMEKRYVKTMLTEFCSTISTCTHVGSTFHWIIWVWLAPLTLTF